MMAERDMRIMRYTILRPSMIYGADRDRNMIKLLKYLSKWPVFPIFGSGKGLMQPVFVQDLADGIVTAILNPELTRWKEYNLCGPAVIPYIELLNLACKALGKHVFYIHVPLKLTAPIVGFLESLPGLPIKKEQVLHFLEDKKFDISSAQIDLKYHPREFSVGIKEEVEFLKDKGIL
jgi:nucleoside-diphosphate-sugar epimerase